jgi:uncharacterized phage protein gp47/JayE
LAEFLDFVPVIAQNIDAVRARMDSDLNAGLDPEDQNFLDSATGGLYYSMTQPLALEIDRLWDFVGTELPASMFPEFSWDVYLDYHGDTLGLTRKPAVKATGTVSFTGDAGTLISTGTQVTSVQTDPDVDPVSFVVLLGGAIPTEGVVDLAIEATDPGPAGNVPAGAIAIALSPVAGVTALVNEEATSGGAAPESDADFRDRILLEYASPPGAGNISDYQRWALAYAPVGRVTVQPVWSGPGTVRVIIMDQANNPVSSVVVAGLQNQLDPIPGQGHGQAPIGATVTVATPTTVLANVQATIIPLSGYTLTGSGGTIPLAADITDSLRRYVNNLEPGDDVIYNHVLASFFAVEGVYNLSLLQINGASTDLSVGALEVARVGTVSLA